MDIGSLIISSIGMVIMIFYSIYKLFFSKSIAGL